MERSSTREDCGGAIHCFQLALLVICLLSAIGADARDELPTPPMAAVHPKPVRVGVRLVVICDPKGVPVGYDLVDPKTDRECESAFRLASAHPGSRC